MSGDNILSSDEVIAKLIEMGFEKSCAFQAVKEVGPSLDNAIDYVLNRSSGNSRSASTVSECSSTRSRKRALNSSILGEMKQSSILDHFQSTNTSKKGRNKNVCDASVCKSDVLTLPSDVPSISLNHSGYKKVREDLPILCKEEVDSKLHWEEKANFLLEKHFGYPSLKNFQKEALAAWVDNQDCLVLAATGSGKSLCFQIPALLTGKVVVVISPLISLMHDQCLKLSRHGISACFLGSGQADSTVEQKALRGMYDIIYVCPETVLRLIKPLERLAEIRGIALFAIDEVHCVSKWGHDFRPDYRRLSLLRENFSACNLNFLKFDVPLMALTATATIHVRQDIVKSLSMSKGTKTVLTSFFRPNLRFSVKHSRTSSSSSYKKDFHQLIDIYARMRMKKQNDISEVLNDFSDESTDNNMSDTDECSDLGDEETLTKENGSTALEGKEMSVEYLENEVDVFKSTDDWDEACGEFFGQSPCKDIGSNQTVDATNTVEERLKLSKQPIEVGPTIIYVPTRKETLSIANYLCKFGVKAAPYNASLSKSHLRRVHKEFQDNMLEVVVATIAFGMGIDKLNVRRIIHYGWPQSLEAYYQEAGRAGRDGKLAECILYANLATAPSLLPSKRSEDQTKQAYKMLSDCFRYGMNTSCCRAKKLVEYFGEDFSNEKCLLCDVCVNGPPEMQNLKEEANILMQIIAAHHRHFVDDDIYGDSIRHSKPNLRLFVSKLREQSPKFLVKDQIWWRGLARILEDKGYIREGDDKIHVQIKFPEPTKLGLEFLKFERNECFNIYPEADMLLSLNKPKQCSSFADWGKGWADPEIRRQRLEKRQSSSSRKQRKPRQTRKRKFRNAKPDMRTARGRITAKLLK